MERDSLAPKPAPVLLKDADPAPAWMSAYKSKPLPGFADLAKQSNLPAVVPMPLARSAMEQGDTLEGVIRTAPMSPELAGALRQDPRVEHLRRMLARDAQALRMSTSAPSGVVLEALPKTSDPRAVAEAMRSPVVVEAAERNTKIPGKIALPDPREPDAPTLLALARTAVAQRASQLPEALRGRMEQFKEALDSVRSAQAQGVIDKRAVLAHTADVSERAFLVSEGAKSSDQRAKEAKEGRVDMLFAISATAARAASREGYKESFQRGLVSDVMAIEQGQRQHEGRPLRHGDDWVNAAQRLQRVGLIDAEDPRAKVPQPAVIDRMSQPEGERVKQEKAAIKEAFADPSAKMAAKEEAKQESAKTDKPKIEIKHEKPKEATAETSVSQVGLSGAYLAAEMSRDSKNATQASKMEADFNRQHEKRAEAAMKSVEDKPRQEFARAATLESAGVKAQALGQPAAQVAPLMAAAAASANTGMMSVQGDSRVRVARKVATHTQQEQR